MATVILICTSIICSQSEKVKRAEERVAKEERRFIVKFKVLS